MAGPGIRYHHIARILGQKHDVTLGVFSEETKADYDGLTVKTSGDAFKEQFDGYDIIFAQWLSKEMIDYAKSQGKVIVFDMYAPVPIEYLAGLEFSKGFDSAKKNEEFEVILKMYDNYLQAGDFFTCSNARQRDFWLGYITANRLLTPGSFLSSNLLTKFSLCPMGIDSEAPKVEKLKLRDRIDGVGKNDFVLLWTGGIWDWFDAKLIVQSMTHLKDTSIKLVFLGTKHPNKSIDEMFESKQARELANKLGLTDKTVFFLDDWVPYDERAAYFMDADAAVYADKESLETRFSHRTRVLDHFWTELPTICSDGDYLSGVIKEEGFGVVVEQRTPEAFAAAITKLASDKKLLSNIKKNLHTKKNNYTWEKTLSPLVTFIDQVDPAKVVKVSPAQTAQTKAGKAPLKRRIKHSAKILLGK